MKSLVILISGRGSNMQALIEAKLPVRIAAVISNRPDAAGLETARMHGFETKVLDQRSYPVREAFDAALADTIDAYEPDLIALAGFMMSSARPAVPKVVSSAPSAWNRATKRCDVLPRYVAPVT